MQNIPQKDQNTCKYSAVHLDKWLRFNQQIEYVAQKTEKVLCPNVQLSPSVSTEVFAFILPLVCEIYHKLWHTDLRLSN